MDSSNAAQNLEAPVGPAALLRGTARGLEWSVDANASTAAIIAALELKLAEAPTFFRGSNVRITVDGGPLANLALVQLAELASRYDLHIVEVCAPKAPGQARLGDSGPMPQPIELAVGSAPIGDTTALPLQARLGEELSEADLVEEFSSEEPTRISVATQALAMPKSEGGTRLVVGPVRSGVILDHSGNLIVFGDVNPGAEVRATGNIVVLGRLKGTAHAAIGSDTGFILALRLEPQQLRIGRRVARAADNDTGSNDAEIAYATGEHMVVERYQGRLPRNLATSIANI
jgi:septum site-determining protein MinC